MKIKDMIANRFEVTLLSIFMVAISFAANKDLEEEITMVYYEQDCLDSSGTLDLKNNSSE